MCFCYIDLLLIHKIYLKRLILRYRRITRNFIIFIRDNYQAFSQRILLLKFLYVRAKDETNVL